MSDEIEERSSRFQFTPFWKLTNFGWLPEYFGRIQTGGDGVYKSKEIIIPFVGQFVLFDAEPDPYAPDIIESVVEANAEIQNWVSQFGEAVPTDLLHLLSNLDWAVRPLDQAED